MKAAVYHGPRDVRVQEWRDPAPPGPDELLLEVVRASICGTDVAEYLHGPHLVSLTKPHPATGYAGPVVLGHEILGRVLEAGAAVEAFAPGDRLVPGAGVWCGRCAWCRAGRPNLCASYHTVGLQLDGGLAELVKVPARMCRRVADSCADDAAVMAQPLAVALHSVRRSGAAAGQAVAVVGVGGIGSLVVAACAARGVAAIAVDVSEERLEAARRLGAARLVNAAEEDAGAALRAETGGAGVDVAIETSGAPSGLAVAVDAVRRGGRVHLVGLQAEPRALDLHRLVIQEVELTTSNAHVCDVDLPEAVEILERSDLGRVALDSVIGLDDVVEAGIERLATGTAYGKIVVNPQTGGTR